MKVGFVLNGSQRIVDAEPGESLQRMLKRIGIHSVRISDDGGMTWDRFLLPGANPTGLEGDPAIAIDSRSGEAWLVSMPTSTARLPVASD